MDNIAIAINSRENFTIDNINELLKKGYSRTEARTVAKQQFGINQTEYNILTKDYKYIEEIHQYVKIEGMPTRIVTSNNPFVSILKNEDIDINDFKLLLKNLNTINEMAHAYKQNSKMLDTTIKIDLDTTETISKSMRANKKVIEEFEEFCERNSQHRKMDLLSMAIKEYMINHNEVE